MPQPVPRPTVYLAGPEVFLPEAVALGRAKCRLCAEAGFEGVFPLFLERERELGPEATARAIAIGLEAQMRACDAIIANLTPFRGVSADAGTAFEVGFMRALGRPVCGYTNVVANYRERGLAARQRGIPPGDGDRPDAEIEDFGLAENLMIAVAIAECGAPVVTREVAPGRELTDLEGFRECLRQLARAFAQPRAT
jgi:nucleoside 2-deoxyribosyltransferase